MTETISRDEIRSRLERRQAITLVEALPPQYFDQGHLPGAINIPHDRVRELAPALLPDRQAPIAVYCASATCRNSKQAAEALRGLGYADVREYVGGKQDWSEAGLPLEPGDARRAG